MGVVAKYQPRLLRIKDDPDEIHHYASKARDAFFASAAVLADHSDLCWFGRTVHRAGAKMVQRGGGPVVEMSKIETNRYLSSTEESHKMFLLLGMKTALEATNKNHQRANKCLFQL